MHAPNEPNEPNEPDESGEALAAGMWFRPTVETREAIERVAKAEKRKLSNAILVLLDEALAARRRAKRAA